MIDDNDKLLIVYPLPSKCPAKLFKELGFHKVLCSLIGEYYIDFLDKVVAILLLAMCIKIYRKYRDNHKQKEMYKNITTFLLCGLLVA